jgi:hypothetical protein
MKLVIEADRHTAETPPEVDETALHLVTISVTHVPTGEKLVETQSLIVKEGV